MAEAFVKKNMAAHASSVQAATTTSTSAATSHHQRPLYKNNSSIIGRHQPLVPIRVDCTSSKQNLRIIETILMDPQVWPVPLVFERYDPNNNDDDDKADATSTANNISSSNNNHKSFQMRATPESIEANVRFLSHNVLTDAEVQGMGRTTRHFTGRAELWSISLQERVMDQIRPQVEGIAQDAAATLYSSTTRNSYAQSQAASSSKRKRTSDATAAVSSSTSTAEEPAEKKSKTTNDAVEQGPTSAESNQTQQQQMATSTATTKTPSLLPPPPCYDPTPAEQVRFQRLGHAVKQATAASALIPIRVRMSVHGIRIHDDFYWDPHLHLQTNTNDSSTSRNSVATNALEMARITGKDLNLPDEAIQAMAVDIVEQVHGLGMVSDNAVYKQELMEIMSVQTQKMATLSPPACTAATTTSRSSTEPHKANVTAAWLLDSRKHATDAAHLVSQHRPVVAAKTK